MSWKVTFALFITLLTLLGFFSLPFIDHLVSTCEGYFFCGGHIKDSLDFLSKTDIAALAFGNFLYNKVITGVITFLVILIFSTIAHRIYKYFVNKPENQS
jgi:putative Mn2+ efflux pump MntP